VSNFRWGLVAACIALIISVALGIISGVRPLYVFLRALVFTVAFFGVGFGLRMIIHSYIPELLTLEEEPVIHENNNSSQRVNITLGDASEYAVPEMYENSGDSNEIGNIEDLISGAFKPRAVVESHADPFSRNPFAGDGIDGRGENDYNMQGGQGAFGSDSFEFQSPRPSSSAPPVKPAFTPSFGDDASLGGLPDLDSMATAFSGGGETRGGSAQLTAANAGFMEPVDAQLFEEVPVSARSVSKTGNKPQQLDGDFNPKEIAMGIRTVLSKEK